MGLGIMGTPMAKNLLKAGHSLVVYDIVPGAHQAVRQPDRQPPGQQRGGGGDAHADAQRAHDIQQAAGFSG